MKLKVGDKVKINHNKVTSYNPDSLINRLKDDDVGEITFIHQNNLGSYDAEVKWDLGLNVMGLSSLIKKNDNPKKLPRNEIEDLLLEKMVKEYREQSEKQLSFADRDELNEAMEYYFDETYKIGEYE